MNKFLKVIFWLGFLGLVFAIFFGTMISIEFFKVSLDPHEFDVSPSALLFIAAAVLGGGIGAIFLIIGLFSRIQGGWLIVMILGLLYLASFFYFSIPGLQLLFIPGIMCVFAGGLFKLSGFLRTKKIQKRS